MLNFMALLLAILIQGLIWAFIVLAASQIYPVLQYALKVVTMIKSFLLGHWIQSYGSTRQIFVVVLVEWADSFNFIQ